MADSKDNSTAKATIIAAFITTIGMIIAAIIARSVSTSTSETIATSTAATVADQEVQKRFAWAYFDVEKLSDFRGENIKQIKQDTKDGVPIPGYYTVFFEQEFPDLKYAAVASNTIGFVTLTHNAKNQITLRNRDANGQEKDDGEMTLFVHH